MQKDIYKSFQNIVNYVYSKNIQFDYPISLYGGISGSILLMLKAYQITGEEKYIKKIEEYIDITIEAIENGKNIGFSFSGGLAGWGWTMQYLYNKGITHENPDSFLNDIDFELHRRMTFELKEHETDNINGAIGIARYFIYRKNTII